METRTMTVVDVSSVSSTQDVARATDTRSGLSESVHLVVGKGTFSVGQQVEVTVSAV